MLLRLVRLPMGRASISMAVSFLRILDSALSRGFKGLGHLSEVLPRWTFLSFPLSTNLTASETVVERTDLGSAIGINPVVLEQTVGGSLGCGKVNCELSGLCFDMVPLLISRASVAAALYGPSIVSSTVLQM